VLIGSGVSGMPLDPEKAGRLTTAAGGCGTAGLLGDTLALSEFHASLNQPPPDTRRLRENARADFRERLRLLLQRLLLLLDIACCRVTFLSRSSVNSRKKNDTFDGRRARLLIGGQIRLPSYQTEPPSEQANKRKKPSSEQT
jgi:hypothetical protein